MLDLDWGRSWPTSSIFVWDFDFKVNETCITSNLLLNCWQWTKRIGLPEMFGLKLSQRGAPFPLPSSEGVQGTRESHPEPTAQAVVKQSAESVIVFEACLDKNSTCGILIGSRLLPSTFCKLDEKVAKIRSGRAPLLIACAKHKSPSSPPEPLAYRLSTLSRIIADFDLWNYGKLAKHA